MFGAQGVVSNCGRKRGVGGVARQRRVVEDDHSLFLIPLSGKIEKLDKGLGG